MIDIEYLAIKYRVLQSPRLPGHGSGVATPLSHMRIVRSYARRNVAR